MSEMIGDIVQDRAELAERLVEAEAEIAELRAQLAAKSERVAELTVSLLETTAELEGVNASAEDEEVAHRDTLRQLAAKDAQVEAWREAQHSTEKDIRECYPLTDLSWDTNKLIDKARALDAEALKAGQS